MYLITENSLSNKIPGYTINDYLNQNISMNIAT